MSWFNQLTDTLEELGGADALDKLSQMSAKVQSSLDEATPTGATELFNKLTLRSPDLQAEHDLIDSQETRKEMVKDYLSALLPWETRDETRDILVEDVQEAIMEMSKFEETFMGPFQLAGGLGSTMFIETENENKSKVTEEEFLLEEKDTAANDTIDSTGNEKFDNEEPVPRESDEIDRISNDDTKKHYQERLEKMGKLPILLDEFDLDAHVGLIERLFKLDANLVKMHSNLSNAGKTEKIFWKNYFFHCAYHRYDKGLGVEEIWVVNSRNVSPPISNEGQIVEGEIEFSHSVGASPGKGLRGAQHSFSPDSKSELLFDQEQKGAISDNNDISVSSSAQDIAAILDTKPASYADSVNKSEGSLNSYEIVETAIIDTDALDEELDELEAEIARELGED